MDLNIERNARYWLLLRNEILNDEIAVEGVGKAIKSISIMTVAMVLYIAYLLSQFVFGNQNEHTLAFLKFFVVFSVILYMLPVLRKFNQAADLMFTAKDVYLVELKNLRYLILQT